MSININGQTYLDSRGVAEAAGITVDRLRHVRKPEPDLVINRTHYYLPETVDRWVRARGGRK